jgi:hypothetical protein
VARKKTLKLSVAFPLVIVLISGVGLSLGWKNWVAYKSRQASASTFLDSELINRYTNVINKHLASYNLENLPLNGVTGGPTIAGIVNANPGKPQVQLEQIFSATCGEGGSSDLTELARWRQCRLVIGVSLISYYDWMKNGTMSTALAYSIAYDTDSLSTLPSQTPYHGFISPGTRLGDTDFAKNYLNDSGMGVLSVVGWVKNLNRISQYYCTTKETPFDSGKTCKTIDLYSRYVNVAKRVISTTDNFRTWRSGDIGYQGRSAVGRFAAAKISGDSSLIFRTGLEAEDLVMREWGTGTTAPAAPIPVDRTAISDVYQHLGVLFSATNYNVTPEIKLRFPIWLDTYLKTYFHPTYPITNLTANSYSDDKITSLFSPIPHDVPVLATACGQNLRYTKDPVSKTTMGIRGEHPSDNILTSLPQLYYISKDLGSSQTSSLRTYLNTMLQTLQVTPAPWIPELCNSANAWGSSAPKTQFSITLRQFGYYYIGWNWMWKRPIGSFSTTTPVRPAMDAIDDYVLGSYLQQSIWRTNVGFTRRVPLDNSGNPNWLTASPWSAPITAQSTLPAGRYNVQAQSFLKQPNNTMLLSIWRDNLGYSKTFTISGNEVIWSSDTTWSSPISPPPNTGTGNIQAQSDIIIGSTLLQSVWRNDIGYIRWVPIVNGAFQWSCQSTGTCPWTATALSLAGLPGGNVSVQAQSGYITGGKFYQTIWQGGNGWSRAVPIVNGNPSWSCQNNGTCPWSGPIITPGF